jgi:hypothetical protein
MDQNTSVISAVWLLHWLRSEIAVVLTFLCEPTVRIFDRAM